MCELLRERRLDPINVDPHGLVTHAQRNVVAGCSRTFRRRLPGQSARHELGETIVRREWQAQRRDKQSHRRGTIETRIAFWLRSQFPFEGFQFGVDLMLAVVGGGSDWRQPVF